MTPFPPGFVAMLDRKFIVENAAAVKENCLRRNSKADIDRFVELALKLKATQQELDEARREHKSISEEVGRVLQKSLPQDRKQVAQNKREIADAKKRLANAEPAKKLELESLIRSLESDNELTEKRIRAMEQTIPELIDCRLRVERVSNLIASLESQYDETEIELAAIGKTIPNMSHPAAPIGGDDQSNLVVRKGKHEPPKFDFKPLDHVVLGEKLDLIDFEAGAKTTGHGFYFLKNEAVLLELALQQYAVNLLMAEGFTPMITPDLARNEVLHGTGYIPRGPETQIYSIADSDLSLIATAEITLGGYLADTILEEDVFPLKMCGISHCYRTEAGAGGRASRGLYRVHQFTKVEMFAYTLPEQSDAMLETICALECKIFDGLGIAYQVVDTATGDLGGPAYRKYDLEAWMPGRGNGGEYGEVTSTSNCTDYQSRRLGIRYRKKGEKGTHFVHTLNGTAVALSRAMIAVIENYQQADGTILVPEALRPYMCGMEKIGGKPVIAN